jgi:hypothetical protein
MVKTMTPEQKLDRLERIAKLFVRAGLRERRRTREIAEKVDILAYQQAINEDKLASAKMRMENELQETQMRNEEEFRKGLESMKLELRETQKRNEDALHETQMRNEEHLWNGLEGMKNELRETQLRNEGEMRAVREEVFELFKLTDQKIGRLTDAQMIFERKLNALIERS